jgi:hypothetical protein
MTKTIDLEWLERNGFTPDVETLFLDGKGFLGSKVKKKIKAKEGLYTRSKRDHVNLQADYDAQKTELDEIEKQQRRIIDDLGADAAAYDDTYKLNRTKLSQSKQSLAAQRERVAAARDQERRNENDLELMKDFLEGRIQTVDQLVREWKSSVIIETRLYNNDKAVEGDRYLDEARAASADESSE